MGEPLANFRRVVDAAHRICDPAPDGLGISQRSVTVSTVGLMPAIRGLADERLQVTLAVDLNDQPWRVDLLAKRLREHLNQLVHVNNAGQDGSSSERAGSAGCVPAARQR